MRMEEYMRLILFMLFASCAFAQNLVELRVAQNQYRYADYLHTFRNNAVADVYYIGVPGANEVTLGLGYQFKIQTLTLIPVAYVASVKEGPRIAAKFGLIGGLETGSWKSGFYLAHLLPLQDGFSSYRILDALDVTMKLGKRWELGGSFGLFHQDGKWTPQYGPIVKMSDKHGQWGFSFRVGTGVEARFIRVWTF